MPPDNVRGTAPADRPSQIHRLAGARISLHDTPRRHHPRCALACSTCYFRSCLVPVDELVTETVVELMGIAS